MIAIQYCNHPETGDVAKGTYRSAKAEVQILLNGFVAMTLHGTKAYQHGGHFVLQAENIVVLNMECHVLQYCEEVDLPIEDSKSVLRTIADIMDENDRDESIFTYM